MKKIWSLLTTHLRKDFSLRTYGLVFLYLTLALAFNYYFDFEDDYIDRVSPEWRIQSLFLWYLFHYACGSLIVLISGKKSYLLKKGAFWGFTCFIILCMCLDSGFPVYEWIVRPNFDTRLQFFASKILRNLLNIPFVILPALVFYWLQKDLKNNFFGVTAPFDPKPYLFLLLAMMPLLFAASQLENFSSFYPMYDDGRASEYLQIPELNFIFLYELVYGWNFFSVEFIFRGLLVIGMSRILGKEAILPMVVLYCVYHFGKPMGEAISSIFGGYILGIIAYSTRSIFGGVLIHVGIAWMMEVLGFIF